MLLNFGEYLVLGNLLHFVVILMDSQLSFPLRSGYGFQREWCHDMDTENCLRITYIKNNDSTHNALHT